MKFFVTSAAVSALCFLSTSTTTTMMMSSAFVVQPGTTITRRTASVPSFGTTDRAPQTGTSGHNGWGYSNSRMMPLLFDSTTSSEGKTSKKTDADDEIERLRAMAAKLRAEAAELEADKAKALADAVERVFRQFDVDKDGEISLAELKEGLEKKLKTELSESRVKSLMNMFDTSGDGVLQVEEFVTVDKFKNKLDALVREEKRLAAEAAKNAKKEAEEATMLEARLGILNENPPTGLDKAVSILPYLFPLLDGLAYGRFLLQGEVSNPLVGVVAVLYTLYRSIPFSGFVAFFALNFLAFNPRLNRLVRFNMQQAIFLDIALFFPGLISGIYNAVLTGMGMQVPAGIAEVATDAVFVTLLLTLAYCTVSSLLGITPDKIPLISQAVKDRTLSSDMFDDQGKFIPRQLRDEKEDEEKDKDKKD